LARISQSFRKRWREPDDLVIAARDVFAVGIPIVMRPPGPDAGRAVMGWKYEDVPTLANVKFNTLGRHAVPIGIVPAGQGWVRDIGKGIRSSCRRRSNDTDDLSLSGGPTGWPPRRARAGNTRRFWSRPQGRRSIRRFQPCPS
jgi:hypothetical protein